MCDCYGYEEKQNALEAVKNLVEQDKEQAKRELEYARKLYEADRARGKQTQIPPGFDGQPAPKKNEHKPTWHLVIQDMLARDGVGRKRYNTPLQPFNGRDSLQDAYEEALDLCVYLKNAIEERNAGKA